MGAIHLIRHGQASFGSDDYDRLSPLGVEQAEVLGLSLRRRVPAIDRVVCGGMRRHAQTAEGALGAMGLPCRWDEDRNWMEYDHVAVLAAYQPRWADQAAMMREFAALPNARQAFQAEFGKAMQRWVGGLHNDDYPESWAGFCARVDRALTELHTSLGKSQTALVFTSGGPITAVIQRMLHLSDENAFRLNWTLANAAISKLIYSSHALNLSTVNDHAHFEGEHARLITYR